MKTTSRSAVSIRSKMSIWVMVLGVGVPLLITAAAIIFLLALRSEGFEEIFIAWTVHLLWIFPLFFLVAFLFSYPVVAVGGDTITVRSFQKRRTFLRSDITGYGEKWRWRRGKTLLLALRTGEWIRVPSSYYRNYPALRQALTEGLEPMATFPASLKKQQDKHLLIWAGLLFGACLLSVLYLKYNLRKEPLDGKGLQTIQAILSEDPRVELEEEDGEPLPARVALITQDYPDIEFQLKGAALYATRIDSLSTHLHSGDRVRLLADKEDYHYAVVQKDHPIVRLRAVDVYAIRSKGRDMLSLRAYNAERQRQLEYEDKTFLIALFLAGLFLVWRGWVYLR